MAKKTVTRKTTKKQSTTPRKVTRKKTKASSPTDEILGELRALRASLEPARPSGEDLDEAALSVRRLLEEIVERRLEAVAGTLVVLRQSLSSGETDPHGAARQIDRLIEELGAVRFEAEALDYPDPLIHSIVAERSEPSAPDGVVLEALEPGFRTNRGAVLAKARVAVNRRA